MRPGSRKQILEGTIIFIDAFINIKNAVELKFTKQD